MTVANTAVDACRKRSRHSTKLLEQAWLSETCFKDQERGTMGTLPVMCSVSNEL
jgi:DNA-directed RNA polymerase specialized sigma24 family protein